MSDKTNLSGKIGSTMELNLSLITTTMSPEEWHRQIWEYISPTGFKWIFIVLYILVFIFGLGGNFLVCFAVWKNIHLRTVTNYFLVNLACADFMVILVCLPLTLIHDIFQSWILGLAMCKIATFLQKVSVLVSVLTLTAISLERYMAICRPLSFRVSKFKTKFGIFLVWIIAMASAVPDLISMIIIVDDVIPEDINNIWLTVCVPVDKDRELIYQLVLTVVYYFLPLLIMGFSYARIAYCLWSSTTAGPATCNGTSSEGTASTLKTRKRIAKMLIMVVGLFMICYLPVYLLNVFRYANVFLKSNEDFFISYVLLAHWLCYFNSAINPVIYNFMSEKFKKEFREACACCRTDWVRLHSRRRDYEDPSTQPLRGKHQISVKFTSKDPATESSDSRTEMIRIK